MNNNNTNSNIHNNNNNNSNNDNILLEHHKICDVRADYIRYYRDGQETILVDTIAALDEILSYESSTA
jgi:hypothetical protein